MKAVGRFQTSKEPPRLGVDLRSTPSSSSLITVIVTFLIKIYVPTWFQIKIHPSITMGSRHFFSIIQQMQNSGLPKDILELIQPTVQRNGYFSHHESILILMIQDERPFIRQLAWRRILRARNLKCDRLKA